MWILGVCSIRVFAKNMGNLYYKPVRDNMEEKPHPVVDSPVYGESGGVNFILLKD